MLCLQALLMLKHRETVRSTVGQGISDTAVVDELGSRHVCIPHRRARSLEVVRAPRYDTYQLNRSEGYLEGRERI